MNDKMREEFEQAIAEEAGQPLVAIQLSRKDESYSTSPLIYAWWAWQKSRMDLVIELPQEGAARYWEEFEEVEGQCFNWAKYNRHVKEALAIAGLKVTP